MYGQAIQLHGGYDDGEMSYEPGGKYIQGTIRSYVRFSKNGPRFSLQDIYEVKFAGYFYGEYSYTKKVRG